MYRSYNAKGLITSDCVLVKRGQFIGMRGHIVNIHETTVDIHVKNSDNVIISAGFDQIVLRHRMFFRSKDIRKTPDEKFIEEFRKMNLAKNQVNMVELFEDLNIKEIEN